MNSPWWPFGINALMNVWTYWSALYPTFDIWSTLDIFETWTRLPWYDILAGFCLGWIKKKQVVLYFSTLSDIFSLYVSCVTKYNSKYKECNLEFVLNPNFGKHVNVELTYVCSRDGHGVIVWQYVQIPTRKELPVSFGGGVFPDQHIFESRLTTEYNVTRSYSKSNWVWVIWTSLWIFFSHFSEELLKYVFI